ncbi:MAG: hypothetical protein LV481_16340 [Methylacidiphilales bacterium]|nr:hypothetical protein [Candidatus Methylacidiphilales bacterium]
MKTNNSWDAWIEEQEQQLQLRRHRIIEQAGCFMVRFIVDDATRILPYSYFTRAECNVQNDHFQIVALWPGFTVTIEGYHLDQLTDLLAEHRLHSVTLRTGIEEDRGEGELYLERIGFASAGVQKSDSLTSEVYFTS